MDFSTASSVLFCPLKISGGTISSRIDIPLVPTCFAERASYPGTLISPRACGYPHPPGIWTNGQVAAWKAVTAAIGALGRITHPIVLDLPLQARYHAVKTTNAIKALIKDFATAAKQTVNDADFDGVEVHGGYGHLVDQFVQDTANQRTDSYDGNIENRSRFAVEDMGMSDPMPQFIHLVQQLRGMKLSYLHLVEHYAACYTNDAIALYGDSNDILIHMWGKASPVILNHGFDALSTCKAIEDYIGVADIAVAMGATLISNPDLIYRIACPDRSKSHSVMDPDGYITYSFSDEWEAE
ncbi:hypothetical protein ACQKWADRAFT_325258 [Trichoderma austrokoningii]